ncbi:MAG: hypothetical protein Kow0069_06040 [Promethearchaeota archaeon]
MRPDRQSYSYDPHLDPSLQWAGKAERTSFEPEPVRLRIHERVSPADVVRTISRNWRRNWGGSRGLRFEEEALVESEKGRSAAKEGILDLDRVRWYEHGDEWTNRLILGDSLQVMGSLLAFDRLGGRVQTVFFDPPYGVGFNSNFQVATNSRHVRDGSDDHLTREPEQVRAYRDTWHLGVHSYLTYLRDRLLLCRELLADEGSIFVQISQKNLHYVTCLMEEVFGRENHVATIPFKKTGSTSAKLLPTVCDFLVWFARDKKVVKYRPLYVKREVDAETLKTYNGVELPDGTRRSLTRRERETGLVPPGGRLFTTISLTSQGHTTEGSVPFEYQGRVYRPPRNRHWSVSLEGLRALAKAGRLHATKDSVRFVYFLDDFPVRPLSNLWDDTMGEPRPTYVVQTNAKVVARCVLMTSDPGDLVLDPTCGSGTTAVVAEQWGRRWITCDTSRVALALAKQRLLTSAFPYYELKDDERGVAGGFVYRRHPHVSASTVAYGTDPPLVEVRDDPVVDPRLVRVAGPFVVEGVVPATVTLVGGAASGMEKEPEAVEEHLARMLKCLELGGIRFHGDGRGRGATQATLENVRPVNGTVLHAEAMALTAAGVNARWAFSFGPPHGPVTGAHVEAAAREAAAAGCYERVVVVGFAFDAGAQVAAGETRRGLGDEESNGKGRTRAAVPVDLALASPDLTIQDLLKKNRGTPLVSVIGNPDASLERSRDGFVVKLLAVDSFDPVTGELASVPGESVAAWFLDQNFDGRTFRVEQAFFPGRRGANPWQALQRALKGAIDPEAFDAMRSTTSLPFAAREGQVVAVKVVDFAGRETMTTLVVESDGIDAR